MGASITVQIIRDTFCQFWPVVLSAIAANSRAAVCCMQVLAAVACYMHTLELKVPAHSPQRFVSRR